MANIYSPGDANRNFGYHYISGGGQSADQATEAYNRLLGAGAYSTPNSHNASYGGGVFAYGGGGGGSTGNMPINTSINPDGTPKGGYGGGGNGYDARMGGGAGGGTTAAGSGAYTTSIDANDIYSQPQIQGAVNSQNATIDNRTQQAGQRQSQQLAGRGFGASGGGLGAALRSALGSNANAQRATGEQTLRFNTAQQNAQHRLQGQTARAGEGVSLGNMLLQQRGQDISSDNANRQQLLGMIMSTIGGMS